MYYDGKKFIINLFYLINSVKMLVEYRIYTA